MLVIYFDILFSVYFYSRGDAPLREYPLLFYLNVLSLWGWNWGFEVISSILLLEFMSC